MRNAVRLLGLALVALGSGCADSDGSRGAGHPPLVFAPEGNRLAAYDSEPPFAKQVVLPSHADDPEAGRDVNGQVCFDASGLDPHLFVLGEDTGQPAVPPAWGVFRLSGRRIGDLTAEQVGRLVTTFQPSRPSGDPYGCGFLSDGRLVTTDIGPDDAGPAGGQLILWFSPLDAPSPRFCKLDVEVGTAGGIHVDEDDRVYVASARVFPGIHRYSGPFPTSDDAAGGCGRRDATGAPLADRVQREHFIRSDMHAQTPNAVAASGRGTFYVSSVLNGVIAEYDSSGVHLRNVLQPPPGERLGETPFTTGSPLGFAVAPDGTIFYADLGLVFRGSSIGPGPRAGSVRRVAFADAAGGAPAPRAPEALETGLSFPDAIGIFVP